MKDIKNEKNVDAALEVRNHVFPASTLFGKSFLKLFKELMTLYIVISNDEEEDIPTPTVETQVQVICRKRVYSLVDESESDEE
ncbi:hypothetical protein Tco_1098049 [Tanacetum coccineum]